MTANHTSSRRQSMAVAVASRAAWSLVGGWPIDPEQSSMMTSAASVVLGPVPPPSDDTTVTIALTSDAPSARYSFWYVSAAKVVTLLLFLSESEPQPRNVVLAPRLAGEPGEMPSDLERPSPRRQAVDDRGQAVGAGHV